MCSLVPPKSTTALEIVVRHRKKDLENDGKYKVISENLSLNL